MEGGRVEGKRGRVIWRGQYFVERPPQGQNTPDRFHHQKFTRDQVYEGEFFRESLHGEGTYKWKDSAVYEGGFYSNYEEGYAITSYPDNSYFEVNLGQGLFIRNKRFGPGIYTYSNGRQDVGFWMGPKLVRLSRAVDFIVPRLAPTSAGKIKLLQFQRLIPIDEESFKSVSEIYNRCGCPSSYLFCPYSSLIFDPRSYFFDKVTFEKIYFLNVERASEDPLNGSDDWGMMSQEEEAEGREESFGYSPVTSRCLCDDKEFVMSYRQPSMIDMCEKESKSDVEMGILAYFTHYGTIDRFESGETEEPEEIGETEEKVKLPKMLAWNRSELCVRMLQQIFRYRAFEGKLTFNIAKLMTGARTAFRKTGEKEKQCVEFLKTCALGQPQMVRKMLCDYDLSEELTDARGNNSVMFAAATDQHEIIDILLDYGADVNSFNDEGLTPLNLCLLRRLAQLYHLGRWETAFLPKEMEKTDDGYETEEWRKQISIPSLDRIFGDGTSLYDPKDPQSSTLFNEKESPGTKSRSLIVSEMSSGSALPTMSKSLLNTGKVSVVTKSLSFPPSGIRTTEKSELKIQLQVKTMEEFETSVRPSGKGSYFFELAPEEKPGTEERKKENWTRFRRMSQDEDDGEEIPGEGYFYSSELRRKIVEIDKTIEKLLKRGADPNLSEVPKPSIHLAVYARDSKIVHLLLRHGADPNCQLYSNEGLLAPLHLLVLSKPSLESVNICDLLLNFAADPEVETLPEFAFHEGEKAFLDLTHGRTPLQLLSMRPDLEFADPEGHLTKVALTLAEACNKNRFYKGYSYLALAMCFGNLKLFKAFLDSKYFDPNVLLGNDLGTVLHILVSTEFQKATLFDTSIQICDHLLNAGANPLKTLDYPEKLIGNCIDYGYREIDAEKESRKLSTTEKKENGKKEGEKKSSKKVEKHDEPSERDHLPDHVNVLAYLRNRVEEMKKKKKGVKWHDKKQNFVYNSGGNRFAIFTAAVRQNREEGNESKTKPEQKLMIAEEMTEVKKKSKDGKRSKKGGELWKDDRQDDDDEIKHKKRKQNGKRKNEKNGKLNKGGSENVKRKEPDRKASTKKVNSKPQLKSSLSKSVSEKQRWSLEKFPEKLRQSILKFFGNCSSLDINELFLPYVVLRDGNLYYNLNRKGSRGKEQYSLM